MIWQVVHSHDEKVRELLQARSARSPSSGRVQVTEVQTTRGMGKEAKDNTPTCCWTNIDENNEQSKLTIPVESPVTLIRGVVASFQDHLGNQILL
jgi:hypothetical protein